MTLRPLSGLRGRLLLAGLATTLALVALPAAAQPPRDPLAGPPQRTAAGTPEEPVAAPIELRGTVYLGAHGTAARLYFLTGSGENAKATADAGGAYHLRAMGPLRAVTIEIDGRSGPSFRENFATTLRASGERDFHLPASELRVKVVDAVTGKPVPGANLTVSNRVPVLGKDGLPLPPRSPGQSPPATSYQQSLKAGPDGVASQYYLLPGQVAVRAWGRGYQRQTTPQTGEIHKDELLEMEVRLSPEGAKSGLRVLLPNGDKAVRAAVLVLENLNPMKVSFAGVTDAEGRIEVPANLGGSSLAIRHPDAALHIGSWAPAAQDAETRLEEAAEKPLTIHATAGGTDLAYAEVALGVGSVLLTTHLLYQLTGASPMTDEKGRFTAHSLPKGEVGVLVFTRHDSARADAIRGGRHNDKATIVPYPWPDLVEVKGVQ